MSTGPRRLRVVTYNIHKCQGLDGRVRPQRIVEVLRELDADVIGLQEVVRHSGSRPEDDQAHYLAEAMGMHLAMGSNRLHRGGPYGNLMLSRLPILHTYNHDLSVANREKRGALRTDVEWIPGHVLHVFNVHLGTAFLERRTQARLLTSDTCLRESALRGPRIVLGDFNEWTRGLASQLLSEHLQGPDLRPRLKAARSYPGVLPLLHLDHIYYDPALHADHVVLHRSRTALIASDHLPLVADFRLTSADGASGSLAARKEASAP